MTSRTDRPTSLAKAGVTHIHYRRAESEVALARRYIPDSMPTCIVFGPRSVWHDFARARMPLTDQLLLGRY